MSEDMLNNYYNEFNRIKEYIVTKKNVIAIIGALYYWLNFYTNYNVINIMEIFLERNFKYTEIIKNISSNNTVQIIPEITISPIVLNNYYDFLKLIIITYNSKILYNILTEDYVVVEYPYKFQIWGRKEEGGEGEGKSTKILQIITSNNDYILEVNSKSTLNVLYPPNNISDATVFIHKNVLKL